MFESPAREWRFYLDDMIGFAETALAYTEGLGQAEFAAHGLTYDATVRNLELLGEVATRNRLIHGYLGIDNDTLWSIIQHDVPSLLPRLYELQERHA